MAQQIIEQGAIISFYPPGTQPDRTNFPTRNRIISGLSMGVVVVEAGSSSGALLTAEFAGEQGREIFAVPGNILSPQSKGTNKLIQQGANQVLEPKDVLEVLDLTRVTQHREARAVLPANEEEAKLFELISHEPLHVDEISVQADMPVEQVSSTLALMELKGMVRQMGGMRYVGVREEQADYQAEVSEK